jgi:hypothetical protein
MIYKVRAVGLFKDGQYSWQIIFEKVKSTTDDEEVKSDCAYYKASCRLNQSNADSQMAKFVEEYPTSAKK